jgi:hypothetical protein
MIPEETQPRTNGRESVAPPLSWLAIDAHDTLMLSSYAFGEQMPPLEP